MALGGTLTDARLLEDFVSRRDEASFEVLVWRHGTMVLNLCQRVLHDTHEAEDAFQAAFLVFARKASSIGKHEAVAAWLYKVAYRIALRVRTRAAKHVTQEAALDNLPAPDAHDEVLWRDLRLVLDEEIDRLPEKYRVPFVLCYLQGHTNEEAAEQLGCPKGTILSRLARGRERLRSRLVRRGVALTVGGLATALIQNAATATVPAALVSVTTKAALAFVAGNAAPGLVSATVVALTEGVLHTMFLTKLKIAAAVLLALAVLGTATACCTRAALAQKPPSGNTDITAARPAENDGPPSAPADPAAAEFIGKVIAVAKDGKSFTVEIPPAARGDEAKKVEVKIGDKTAVTYSGVGSGAAKLTEGYQAKVLLAEGSKDVAATVQFMGTQNFRAGDIAGKVTAVAKDGKGITVEESVQGKGPGENPKTIEIKFTDKTRISYSLITRGGAKLVEGLNVEVWLVHDSKDVAGRVHLYGSEAMAKRGDKTPNEGGRVVAVSTDGKTITLESRRPGLQGRPPKRVEFEVKVGDKTSLVYHNVEADGTKVVEGMQALVWLEEGSKDRAAKISLTAKEKNDAALIDGKVASVGKDGKTITIEVPDRIPGAGGVQMKQVEVKIDDKTRIAYHNVGPDEAKPTEGYYANVRLAEGSKDTAGQILFTKTRAERGR
jgi:RNA polymerase sigma factor (sigma-70 family)